MSVVAVSSTLRPRVAAELLKPITWFAPIWAFGCGAVSTAHPIAGRLPEILAGAVLAGPMVCGASQAVNDWFDRDVDAINQPGRPVPSGRAPGRSALYLAVVWSALGLALGAALGTFVLVATLIGLGLAWAYSAPPLRLKAEGWVGPAACALCYEGLAWMTGAAVAGGEPPGVLVVTVALLYSLGAVGIMVLNDFKSVEGDRALGLRSLPVLLGPANACRLACALMALAQAVVIAVLLDVHRPLYALAIAVLLAVQVGLMPRLLRDPRANAPWYNGTGTTVFVLGMLATAFALRGGA